MTRSSIGSTGITETSKRLKTVGSQNSLRQQSNLDLPLQRNVHDFDSRNVSPIIEDDKEEAGDEDTQHPHSSYKKKLINQFVKDNDHGAKAHELPKGQPQSSILPQNNGSRAESPMKPIARNNIKIYKADMIVNTLVDQLFGDIKSQFKKAKPGKHDDNKENELNHQNAPKEAGAKGVKKIKNPLTKQSIKQRKIIEKNKPKRPKIGDYVKVTFGETWGLKQTEPAKETELKPKHEKGARTFKMPKAKKQPSVDSSIEKDDKRRKRIG